MPDQFDMFDLGAAKEAKREGMARAALGAGEEWKVAMTAALIETARKMNRFTTDDVYITFYTNNPETPPTTRDDRAMGPIMSAGAREGICRQTGDWRKSIRVSRHHTDLRIWRSLILEPDTPTPPLPPSPLPPTNAYYDKKKRLIHDQCAIEGCTNKPGLSVGNFLRKAQLGMWYCANHWPGWAQQEIII